MIVRTGQDGLELVRLLAWSEWSKTVLEGLQKSERFWRFFHAADAGGNEYISPLQPPREAGELASPAVTHWRQFIPYQQYSHCGQARPEA